MDYFEYLTFIETNMILKGMTAIEADNLWNLYHPDNMFHVNQ